MGSLRDRLLDELRGIALIDPHTHINPHQPASQSLADLLGYHYYTELAHSAGLPREQIEEEGLSGRELVRRLVPSLRHLTNTAQYAWLIEICQNLFGLDGEVIDEENWEALFDRAEGVMAAADWPATVLDKANVEAVFLTNDFDDALEGFDAQTYIPCLRTDDLVFHLAKPEVRDRLAACTSIDLNGSLGSLRDSLQQRFEHFTARGAKACAISLPPDFQPTAVPDGRALTAWDAILRQGTSVDPSHRNAIARRVFWTIVELCDEYQLPMDLMIGVNRGVYESGVYQGRDLYDSRVSLIQYGKLFNAFPSVRFPISVLASVTNQELVSYAWIFPNVITNGHWWYSNTPTYIEHDLAARLEAVPRTKQIGYYSDAYKLEFVAPKFDMYRRILASILADDFCVERGWSESKAIDLGYQILRGNVESIFLGVDSHTSSPSASGGDRDFARMSDSHLLLDAATASRDDAITSGVDGSAPSPADPALAANDDDEPLTLEGLDFDQPSSDAETAINYFRADDDPHQFVPQPDSTDTATLGLVADPATGELTWPLDDPGPPSNNDDDRAAVVELMSDTDDWELESVELSDDDRHLRAMDESDEIGKIDLLPEAPLDPAYGLSDDPERPKDPPPTGENQ